MFDRLCPVTRSIRQSLAMELNVQGDSCVALQRYQPRRLDEEKSVSSVQDWGHEVEEGAVYSVAMKKIQIKEASHKGHRWLGVESDPRAPGHGGVDRYETCRVRSIRAGTLAKLVENLLLSFGDDDSIYISVFLATFRAFTTTGDVLRLLIDEHGERKNGDCDDGRDPVKSADQTFVRKAVAFILRVWMDQYPEDFHADAESLALVLAYVSRVLPHSELQRRALSLRSPRPETPPGSPASSPAPGPAAARQKQSGHAPFSLGEDEADPPTDARADAAEERPYLLSFPAQTVARQLTLRDAELFKKVAPHHCLGCVWSRRDRKGNRHLAPSVRATIAQFNAVAACVACTVLRCLSDQAAAGHGAPSTGARHAAAQRARVVEHWIAVAQECRMLKNFSSLRAILSALQTNPIHRLKKTWCCVSREKIVAFAELSEIFSDENNHFTSRELLMKEGTSKFASLDSNGKESQKRTFKRFQTAKEPGLMQGTIPYLGTFLTDLTMLDTAFPDYVEGGLINFEKRRKEFEVIAQIRLLQLACNNYSLSPEGKFLDWFNRQEKLSEEESYALSCEIEPPTEVSPTSPRQRKSVVKRLSLLFIGVDVAPGSPQARTPNGEVAALEESPEGGAAGATGGEGCGLGARAGDGALASGGGGAGGAGVVGGERADCLSVASSASEHDDVGTPADAPDGCPKELSTSSSLASLHSADVSSGVFAGSGVSCSSSSSSSSSSASSPRSSFRLHGQRSVFNKTHQRSVSCCSAVTRPVYNRQSDDSCIIRVVLQSPSDGNLYKSVLLTSQDKTSSVIGKAMVKYNLEMERAEDYQLVQVISNERELVMPDRANVFYAMSTSANFDFVLRKKGSPRPAGPAAPPPPPSRSQSSSSLPNLKSKGGSLTQRLNRAAL
ncbi:ral guanine nucleotide dissociation stimulator-like 1 [Lampetra fluviatilis]